MDLRTVISISTLLLVTAESEHTTLWPAVNVTSLPAQTNSTSRNCPCTGAAPAATAAPARALGLLTVSWTSECKGDVNLILYHPSSSSLPVCLDSEKKIQSVLGNVCQNKTGCEGTARWHKGRTMPKCYSIKESGEVDMTSCDTLRVHCSVLADVQGRLQAYKVVTALLCCVLLVLFVIRFTRPTVKALQKRLSDRRQNRWIGPTQSHSVSYHRGKTAVKNNDKEKRLSYPALERLVVTDSREPSSNRNSGYNV